MEFDNATNLDRKFGVRGTKRKGRSPTIAFARSTKALQKSPPSKPFINSCPQDAKWRFQSAKLPSLPCASKI
jgi:hypothetical protein